MDKVKKLELKKYQEETIGAVEQFCKALTSNKGEPVPDLPAWQDLEMPKGYTPRFNRLGKATPNICLKIPTGGGKTLMGIKSIQTIKREYLKNSTGLVVWVMPTKAIYNQTIKGLKDYDHPYRQELDRIAPNRRIKIKEKTDRIHPEEIANDLVILVLMLQSASRKDKEFLKMHRENSKYQRFFPSPNEMDKIKELISAIPNLEYKEESRRISIKSSLANMLKMSRPLVIIDEAHRAETDIATDTIDNMNPSFLLELTATPSKNSNILVDILGTELKKESMIKLPIQLTCQSQPDWKSITKASMDKLKELENYAEQHHQETGQYIRPIGVVRAEFTGKKQVGKGIHAYEVKKYLIQTLRYTDDEVKIKSSENDEIGNIDLLSPECRIKVIITKDALKEGWDCPFAYVLTILDNSKSTRGLTQMLGRVLRQPYASESDIQELNQAYVFCLNPNVHDMVKGIEKGLQDEGLGDAKYMVNRALDDNPVVARYAERRVIFKNKRYVLPKVLIGQGEEVRDLEYERDILANVEWDKISPPPPELALQGRTEEDTISIDLESAKRLFKRFVSAERKITEQEIAMQIHDVIPNTWQALRIGRDFLQLIDGQTEQEIYDNKERYLSVIRQHIKDMVDEITEKQFRKKVASGEIYFNLDTRECRWEIPHKIAKTILKNDKNLRGKYGNEIENSLFPEIERHYNSLEKSVATYISEKQTIEWWHRVAKGQEFGIQGWRKHLVYPDFLILDNGKDYIYLETKGNHLKEFKDTETKKRLFECLNNHCLKDLGESKIGYDEQFMTIRLAMINEEDWEKDVIEVLSPTQQQPTAW